MDTNKQPVKEVPPQPRHPTPPPVTSSPPTPPPVASFKHTTGSIQHVQVASSVVSSFNLLKPPETQRDRSLLSQMKTMRSLRQAGITAVFTGQTRVDGDQHLVEVVPFEDVILADIDSLVPSHDETGRPIAEWKRQVMVRQLQVRLTHEEVQDMANGCLPVDGWKYSQTHNAVLGPFGELLTEDDLVYLQRQIETVSLQKRCQVYQLELSRLAQELRLILPDPLINISVNTEVLQQMDAEGHLPLPVWCSRVSEIVRNMSLLLTSLSGGEEGGERSTAEGVLEGVKELQGGKGGLGLTPGLGQSVAQQGQEQQTALEETSSVCRIPHIGTASAFSHQLETNSYSRARRERVEREIQQCGVSVRSLRSNFEGQIGGIYPFAGFVSSSPRQDVKGGQGGKTGTVMGAAEVNNQTAKAGCDLNYHHTPVMETTSLRKERIVVLFLSHWKKSAYAITMRAARLRQAQEEAAAAVAVAAGKTDAMTSLHPQPKITSMFQFCCQRVTVDRMLHLWRGVKSGLRATPTSCPSSCSPSQAPPPRVTYSPEQFLPQVDGVAPTHDTLTLDLFMLGYFHILEQELLPEERKMRHLLCFEVFDHVGSFPWETVRDFHKAVLQEIQAGRRKWSEGFEDIKARFFGNSNDTVVAGRCHQGGARECHHCPSSSTSSLSPDARPVPKVIVQTATPDECGSDTDFSCFSNEEICKYIDRSFAFWKEKEAELFDFEH